ncbi:transcriptional regulator GutM [Acetomicrobium sp. S15 = DSM 107314]|jgi:DNA-binding transcriptional regulator of glucitol operon|uniref:transcriptional regulator GutM n=1 Tax=Acetomicrobium sp. S15 = DSM 107314 TaxID=2529858 RepID=UPI0018E0D4B1|nr:transcriptional regulator GutM [Acetomicrobium sp. S15 = DSM 107314]
MWVRVILLFGAAWFVQALLGYFQVKDYQRVTFELSKKGKLVVGAKRGRLSRGAILAMAVDEDGRILDCKYMKGISVLARFKGLDGLVGRNMFDESVELFLDEPLKKAYKAALSRFAHIKEKGGRSEEEA